jgi:hypothetical protein
MSISLSVIIIPLKGLGAGSLMGYVSTYFKNEENENNGITFVCESCFSQYFL